MVKWSAWRSVLAGAVIGFVEAAGPEAVRRRLRSPLAVVRIDDRRTPDPLAGTGLWLLDPVPDPRPRSADRRIPVKALRLARLHPRRHLRAILPSGS